MIPQYMEKDSKGPAVVPLLAFLVGFSYPSREIPSGFKVDDELGARGMQLVANYQKENELSVEGGCGPQMRTHLLADDFDFELAARSVGGTTRFVQPDGTVITWSPEMDSANQDETAPGETWPAMTVAENKK